MYEIVIVDDEYLIRERIKKCVDWNRLGFIISGEASNGEDALELIERVKPNAALVDINMPFLNGLEFSRLAKEKYPDIELIILTGYGSFDYARDALKVGVSEYLLKPIRKEELSRVLLEIKKKIDEKEKSNKSLHDMKAQCRERDKLLREKFIRDILENDRHDIEKANGEDVNLHIPELVGKRLVVAVIRVDRYEEVFRTENDANLWTFAIMNIVQEHFDGKYTCHMVQDSRGRIALVCDAIPDECEALLAGASNVISSFLDFSITVGVGRECEGIGGLKRSYKEAVYAVRSRILLGTGKVIRYDCLKKESDLLQSSEEWKQSLLTWTRVGDAGQAGEVIGKVLKNLENCQAPVEKLYLVLSEMLLALNEFAVQIGDGIDHLSPEPLNYMDIWDVIEECESMDELIAWMSRLFSSLICSLEGRKQGYSELVVKILDCIENRYQDSELGLESLSKLVFANLCYVSSIFKKETGVTIVEYITDKRMKMAKKLMDLGLSSIEQIAETVGYNDPYYFSKCFKRFYGMPAAGYLKQTRPLPKKIPN